MKVCFQDKKIAIQTRQLIINQRKRCFPVITDGIVLHDVGAGCVRELFLNVVVCELEEVVVLLTEPLGQSLSVLLPQLLFILLQHPGADGLHLSQGEEGLVTRGDRAGGVDVCERRVGQAGEGGTRWYSEGSGRTHG